MSKLLKDLKQELYELRYKLAGATETIDALSTKLAEKEKERHEEWKTGKEWKWEWQKVNRQLEQANQDKISFCIEKLEQVKKYAQHIQGGLIDYIDNQIEQLKKEIK